MFFFIAGIQPRTVRLAKKESACPYCAHFDVFEKRTDHYLAIFFIPLLRVKKGTPYGVCENCHADVDITGNRNATEEENRCRSCGRRLDPNFLYCPYCGEVSA